MEPTPRPGAAPAEPEQPSTAPGLLDDLGRLGGAFRKLFGAQLELLAAELGLARSSVSWMLVAALAATVSGVGFGLTVLGLIGWLLAQWFGSWAWALLVLAVLELAFLGGAIVLFSRCMHWLSLPATRAEWGAIWRGGLRHPRDASVEKTHES